jgi:hypothetical protein
MPAGVLWLIAGNRRSASELRRCPPCRRRKSTATVTVSIWIEENASPAWAHFAKSVAAPASYLPPGNAFVQAEQRKEHERGYWRH